MSDVDVFSVQLSGINVKFGYKIHLVVTLFTSSFLDPMNILNRNKENY